MCISRSIDLRAIVCTRDTKQRTRLEFISYNARRLLSRAYNNNCKYRFFSWLFCTRTYIDSRVTWCARDDKTIKSFTFTYKLGPWVYIFILQARRKQTPSSTIHRNDWLIFYCFLNILFCYRNRNRTLVYASRGKKRPRVVFYFFQTPRDGLYITKYIMFTAFILYRCGGVILRVCLNTTRSRPVRINVVCVNSVAFCARTIFFLLFMCRRMKVYISLVYSPRSVVVFYAVKGGRDGVVGWRFEGGRASRSVLREIFSI